MKRKGIIFTVISIVVVFMILFWNAARKTTWGSWTPPDDYEEIVEKPTGKKSTQKFKVKFAEWENSEMEATCDVLIMKNKIIVYNDGSISGKIGEIIDQGELQKHKSTGKIIISHSEKDTNAKEIGGCTDGPLIIDIENKILWLC